MTGFNTNSSFSSDDGGGDWLDIFKKVTDIAVSAKVGLDAASVEKKRLDIQAAEARAQEERAAQETAASLMQNETLLSILKIGALSVTALAVGFVVVQLFRRR